MTLSDLLVTHSSPTLAAMKGGSLISLRSLSGKGSFSRRELEGKGLSFLTLTNAKEEKLLLVYRRKRLWEELQNETAQRLLQMLGYPEGATLDELLTHLKKRFRSTARCTPRWASTTSSRPRWSSRRAVRSSACSCGPTHPATATTS